MDECQGYPLSLVLFVLAFENFSNQDITIQGMKIPGTVYPFIILQYQDITTDFPEVLDKNEQISVPFRSYTCGSYQLDAVYGTSHSVWIKLTLL